MKISQLPEEIRMKAFKYFSKGTDDLEIAFKWSDTEEGAKYWEDWCRKEPLEPLKHEPLIYSFANEIREEYTTTTTPFKDFLETNNLMQRAEISKENTPAYYDNSKGSIYQFADQQNLNSYEFDIIKRVIRSRKKGNFKEDLEKTKVLIDLYLKETE
jgi:hypothetical protein